MGEKVIYLNRCHQHNSDVAQQITEHTKKPVSINGYDGISVSLFLTSLAFLQLLLVLPSCLSPHFCCPFLQLLACSFSVSFHSILYSLLGPKSLLHTFLLLSLSVWLSSTFFLHSRSNCSSPHCSMRTTFFVGINTHNFNSS